MRLHFQHPIPHASIDKPSIGQATLQHHSMLRFGVGFQKMTAVCCLNRAAVQAGGVAYLLFLLSGGVERFFEGQQLPDQFTARNITITIRTVVQGLSYLLTFIFAANAVGLSGETFTAPTEDRPTFLYSAG
jgi:hypothetical protein